MTNNIDYSTPSTSQPPLLPAPQAGPKPKQSALWWGILAVVVFIALIVLAVYFLLQPSSPTETIRDIFIIFMALESLVIGVALVVLIVQLSVLINLLQHEVKPILDSTNETVNTLRGTIAFLSNNLSEPIIKLNEYIAALKRLVDLFPTRRK